MSNARRPKILLVDDNPRVRSFVRPALEDAGFQCVEAEDGWTALEKMDSETPDLVVLDIKLGDDRMSGLDVCKKIRERGVRTPVVFLTIIDRTDDPRYLERAFRLGGDDYVTKTDELQRLEKAMGLSGSEFLERKSDIGELVARVRARLTPVLAPQEFDGYLRIDLGKQQVHLNREGEWQEVRLAPKEFTIVALLVNNGGRPVGKQRLMDAADLDSEGALQTHIWRIREKLEPDPQNPRYIQVFHKVGYRFRGSG